MIHGGCDSVTPFLWQSYREWDKAGVSCWQISSGWYRDSNISTWSGVDFTVCCGSLFVVERITVTDLVANKISGSGSCLIGKLRNSPRDCETSCRPACSQQGGNHWTHVQINQDRRTIRTLYFYYSVWATHFYVAHCFMLLQICPARSETRETTKHTPK